MRKALSRSLLVLAVAAARAAPGSAVEIVVHPDVVVSEISRSDLSKIFRKRLRTWPDGTMAKPVDQTPDSQARAEFTRLVHRQGVVAIEVYWRREIFSGRGVPPIELPSDKEVVEFVRSTPGAVGYVAAASSFRGVRVLKLEDEGRERP